MSLVIPRGAAGTAENTKESIGQFSAYSAAPRATRRLRIGMFGLRGLRPDLEITGFETAFAEIAPRLVRRGHAVTMYCRAGAHSPARRVPREDGVELAYMPSPGGKNLAAVTSTLLAVLHALTTRRATE